MARSEPAQACVAVKGDVCRCSGRAGTWVCVSKAHGETRGTLGTEDRCVAVPGGWRVLVGPQGAGSRSGKRCREAGCQVPGSASGGRLALPLPALDSEPSRSLLHRVCAEPHCRRGRAGHW